VPQLPPEFAAICCIPASESWKINRLILIFIAVARARARGFAGEVRISAWLNYRLG
jgi:hypothetical protein